MFSNFKEFDSQKWFKRDTDMRTGEATMALGQKLIDKTHCPVAPGSTYEYLDDTTPENLVREDVTVNGVNAFFYKDPIRDKEQEKVLMYIHGGAFICGNGNYARYGGFNLSNNLGLPCFSVEYRLAPEFKLPACLDDVENFYEYLQTEKGYKSDDIIVIGDSAGGELTIALTIRLISRGKDLPYKIIPLHPCTDIKNAPSNVRNNMVSHLENKDTDQIFLGGLPDGLEGMLIEEGDDKNPEVSPIYSKDVSKFPPTYIVADDTEVLLSDTLEFAKKLVEAGVDLKCHIFHYMWHVFEIFFPDIPESKKLWEELKEFIFHEL